MATSLTRTQLEELEAQLRERLAVLRGEIRHALEKSEDESHQALAGQVSDLEDTAFANMTRELNLADAERDAAEVRDIDAALARMVEGDYGICTDCGIAIPFERLRANPSASRCLPCQETREREYAQY